MTKQLNAWIYQQYDAVFPFLIPVRAIPDGSKSKSLLILPILPSW